MIANGTSLEDINKLMPSEAWDLYSTLQSGLWGYVKDYIIAYNTQEILNDLLQVNISAFSKNYKPKPLPKFEKIYPDVHLFLNNGETKKDISIDDQFRRIFGANSIKIKK